MAITWVSLTTGLVAKVMSINCIDATFHVSSNLYLQVQAHTYKLIGQKLLRQKQSDVHQLQPEATKHILVRIPIVKNNHNHEVMNTCGLWVLASYKDLYVRTQFFVVEMANSTIHKIFSYNYTVAYTITVKGIHHQLFYPSIYKKINSSRFSTAKKVCYTCTL